MHYSSENSIHRAVSRTKSLAKELKSLFRFLSPFSSEKGLRPPEALEAKPSTEGEAVHWSEAPAGGTEGEAVHWSEAVYCERSDRPRSVLVKQRFHFFHKWFVEEFGVIGENQLEELTVGECGELAHKEAGIAFHSVAH